MASTLITHVRQLFGTISQSHLLRGRELSDLPSIKNAYLIIEDDQIAAYGQMEELETTSFKLEVIDAHDQFIFPAWCDSHTHLVFAGSREEEFVDKIKGLSYAAIDAKGGGILNSATRLNDISEDELFIQSWKRVQEASRLGTGGIEIKSGYGLTLESELKMLRVIKRLKQKSRLHIKSTFLGAHTYP
jgi:imidazolonepropionase